MSVLFNDIFVVTLQVGVDRGRIWLVGATNAVPIGDCWLDSKQRRDVSPRTTQLRLPCMLPWTRINTGAHHRHPDWSCSMPESHLSPARLGGLMGFARRLATFEDRRRLRGGRR